jgi:predicted transcriptional regulator
VLGPLPKYLEPVWTLLADRGDLTAADLTEAQGTPLATASDYLGELHRLRVALRERESLPAGGSRFVYTLAI